MIVFYVSYLGRFERGEDVEDFSVIDLDSGVSSVDSKECSLVLGHAIAWFSMSSISLWVIQTKLLYRRKNSI